MRINYWILAADPTKYPELKQAIDNKTLNEFENEQNMSLIKKGDRFAVYLYGEQNLVAFGIIKDIDINASKLILGTTSYKIIGKFVKGKYEEFELPTMQAWGAFTVSSGYKIQ